MKAVYFAWVRERVGKAEEELEPPSSVTTVADLIAWLSRRGEGYAYAFEKPSTDPRGARPGPRAARRDDRRREGNRLLSADDGRLSAMATIRVQQEDFDAGAEAAALARGRSDVGAVVSFVGYCRDEGGRLAALELEHYPGMAEEEMARVGARGRGAMAADRRDRDPSHRTHRAGRADRPRRGRRRRIAAKPSRRPRC